MQAQCTKEKTLRHDEIVKPELFFLGFLDSIQIHPAVTFTSSTPLGLFF